MTILLLRADWPLNASVTTADHRHGCGATSPAVTTSFTSIFTVSLEGNTGFAGAPAAATAVGCSFPDETFPGKTFHYDCRHSSGRKV